MIFKAASYWLTAMLIRTIDNGVKKCDSNFNFVVIICVDFVRVVM